MAAQITTKHGDYKIVYDEQQDRWNAFEFGETKDTLVMSSASLSTLRARLDKNEKAKKGFTRVPVVRFEDRWNERSPAISRGEITSLVLPDEESHYRQAVSAWVIWEKRQREKVYDAAKLVLDNPHNAALIGEILAVDRDRKKLEAKREELVGKLQCYRPPKKEE